MVRQGMAVALTTLLAFTVLAGEAQGQEETPGVLVMFDLGDGSVYWQESPLTENRTGIKATEDAAEALGLVVEVSWSAFGAFVADIGGRDPVFPEYFHLLLWNGSTLDWELSPVGASTLFLEPGDTLGWFLVADDPDWDFVSPWPGPKPMATPVHRFPMVAFRGNLANSGATGSEATTSPGLRWRFDTGGAEIAASPVGAGGTLYQVTLFNGTYAIDLQTGTQRWRAPDVSGVSTPTLHREADHDVPDLILGAKDGALYRLRGGSGEVVWRVVLQPDTAFTGLASSPQVSKGQALVGIFNESGGAGGLVAVDVRDGSLQWRHETSSVHMSSPAIQKGSVYIGLMGLFNGSALTWDPPFGLLSVHEENGTERWLFPTSGPVASSPAVVDGVVYFTARDGFLYAVSTEGDLVFQRQIGASTSSPAVGEGLVVAASGVLGATGKVAAFSTNGEPVWEFAPNGPVQSSLTLAGDLVLFATNTALGSVYALWAENGSVAWSYVPEPAQYILPTPIVVDGHVLVASDSGYLYDLVSEVGTRPSVAITSPASGTNLTDATVTVMGTASDDVAVLKVEVRRDGPPWMLASGTNSWQVTLVLPDGNHTLTARVTDNAGNINETSVLVAVQLPREEVSPLVYVVLGVGVITALVLVAAVYLRYVRRLRSP